jgi:hypothetical protein
MARFYATTEQNLIHSFWNALRICRKMNQLHQSLCYTSSIYYSLHDKLFMLPARGTFIVESIEWNYFGGSNLWHLIWILMMYIVLYMYKACFCFLLEILLIQIIVVFLHLFQTESVGVASTTCDQLRCGGYNSLHDKLFMLPARGTCANGIFTSPPWNLQVPHTKTIFHKV